MYPYADDDPPLCRMCGADIPHNRYIRICVECIRKQRHAKVAIKRHSYGRNSSTYNRVLTSRG
jgi:predicted amidophosphoribosyltransferase